MNTTMGDGTPLKQPQQQYQQQQPNYPPGTKVTRIPVYSNSFGEQVVAKVKQPSIKPTPLTNNLQLKPPAVSEGDELRMRKLERQDDARSTWSLIDQGTATHYSGTAEQSDPNNRYYLMFTDLNQRECYMLNMKQLNLQKINTAVRFNSIEEVEAFNKHRAKLAKSIKPQDLGLDDDLESVRQTILSDKLKKTKTKGGSSSTSSSSNTDGKNKGKKKPSTSGGFGEEGEFDFDDGEEVWEVNDDDEGIANKDLNDFEDTGDWAGGNKTDFLAKEDETTFDDNDRDMTEISAQFFGEKDPITGKMRRIGGAIGEDSSTEEEEYYEDSDDDTSVMSTTTTTTLPGAIKRRGIPQGDLEDEEDDGMKGSIKRQRPPMKKR